MKTQTINWTKVTDALPPEGKRVLVVTDDDGIRAKATFTRYRANPDNAGGWPWTIREGHVIAWSDDLDPYDVL